MFPEWTWIVGFFIGASIGSFLNVVIYRVPRNISLSKPSHSFCPKCKHRLEIPDLLPLFSWLILRGQCRHCKERVSSRYFFVELANGIVWAAIWYQYLIVDFGDPGRAIAYSLAASTLIAIIWIDWELYIIPDQINAFLAVIGIAYNIQLYIARDPRATTWGMPSALAGWLVGVGALWGIAMFGRLLFRKDAMGHGDIKMARGIGAVLFPAAALLGFALAVALGAILGVMQILFLKGSQKSDQPVAAGGHGGGGAAGEEGETPKQPVEEPEEEYEEPESIGSLLKSGVGYLFAIDIIGLFSHKLYRNWFGEEAYMAFEEVEEWDPGHTMIPFGPYLALGAIVATVFSTQLMRAVDNYVRWVTGG